MAGSNVHVPDQLPGADREEDTRQPLQELATSVGLVSGPGDKLHNSPLQTDSSLFLSPNEAVVNSSIISGEEPSDVDQYASPSSTPSEHGSNATRLQLVGSEATSAAVNNDTGPPSPTSSVSAEPFSDTRSCTRFCHRHIDQQTDTLTAHRLLRRHPAARSCLFRLMGYPTISVKTVPYWSPPARVPCCRAIHPCDFRHRRPLNLWRW